MRSGTDSEFDRRLHQESTDLDVTWLDRRLDVTPLLAAADLVVLPSLVPETQGMVVIEAMSCGTPAVATKVGGIPETLAAFPDRLVPSGDALGLRRSDGPADWLAPPLLGPWGGLSSVGRGTSCAEPRHRGDVHAPGRA